MITGTKRLDGVLKQGSKTRRRGIALLVVLGFVIVLVVLSSAFAINMQVEAKLARRADAGAELEWVCRSAVEMSKYVLSQQMANTQEPYDSLSQSWAGGPGNTNGFNPFVDSLNLTNSAWAEGTVLGLMYTDEDAVTPEQRDKLEDIKENWRCFIEIVDMERKFNINRGAERAMGRYPLEETFEMMGVDVSLIPYLVDAIFDWRDEDDARGVNGAESEHYEVLGYMAKNGPIDDLRELLLIKDITPEMYWGNATNSLAAGTVPTPVEEESDSLNYDYALVDLFTPISLGYININTAPAEVLRLVLSAQAIGDPAVTAEEIVRVRSGLDGIDGTYDDDPYDNVNQLQLVQAYAANRDALSNAARFFSVRSSTFEVRVTASVRGQERTLVAMLQRKSPKDIKILYTYWES